MNSFAIVPLIVGLLGSSASVSGAAPSIEEFAARSHIESATISPDGHLVALITTQDGRGMAVVMEPGTAPQRAPRVVMTEPEHFRMTWCHWATNSRLLCGFTGFSDVAAHGFVYAVTRLAAVDADGKNLRVLIRGDDIAQGQFQDRIINWNPGPVDTVLIEADEGLSEQEKVAGTRVYGNIGTHSLPAVFELNVVSGFLRMREHARPAIRHWITDKHGNVRLGYGFEGITISYIARLDGDRDWRRLTKFEVFTRDNHFDPIAIDSEQANKAYAYGTYEGRKALWLIDLTDKEGPTLVFAHPAVDVGRPLIARDGRLHGIHYDTGYPMMYFTDPRAEEITKSMHDVAPGQFSAISESSQDERVYLIRSYSDLEPATFRVVDTESHNSQLLGGAYPNRDLSSFASMRAISYPARDGTRIPAYLSSPPRSAANNLPLIVMPHGGPIGRDTWSYFFLRQFLVSRGYAVLQMNFRGSSGYGEDWFFAAHQDWGGLTYDDVVDGTRWAIEQKIADPKRICIVGWSFGGYIALLGAQRNADLFRCSIDIAGVSDLNLLIEEGHHWLSSESIKKQIGTNTDKLKLNSPRQHAADINVPLLILHGHMDAQVPFAQSEEMDSALKHSGKAHRFIALPDADHAFDAEKDRAILLLEVETFLGRHLAAAATSASSSTAVSAESRTTDSP